MRKAAPSQQIVHGSVRDTGFPSTVAHSVLAETSTEQNPIHRYQEGKDYTVVLELDGPRGHVRREKIREVAVK